MLYMAYKSPGRAVGSLSVFAPTEHLAISYPGSVSNEHNLNAAFIVNPLRHDTA
jgi:hypothetical protein